MLPALVSAALAKTAGGLLGGMGDYNAIQSGMTGAQNNLNAGSDVLRAGQAGATQAYSPYTQAGQTGIQGQTAAITGRQQAQGPTLSNSSPQNAMSYLDPSAAYTSNQAMHAAQAAGAAGGSWGGGMMKALANQQNQMSQTNYNNAYNQMMQTNQQNFGQQQQQYQNNNDYQQQQIQNYAGLAGQGLQATGANQQLQAGYNQGINSNYNAMAQHEMNGWAKKGEIFNRTANDFGNNIGGGIATIFGK